MASRRNRNVAAEVNSTRWRHKVMRADMLQVTSRGLPIARRPLGIMVIVQRRRRREVA